MNILVYAGSFFPEIGGQATNAETFARQFHALGHGVTVVTMIPSDLANPFPFPVVRRPGFRRFWSLCRSSDVILGFSFSLRQLPPQLLSGRPVVVKHPNPHVSPGEKVRWIERLKRAVSARMTNIVMSNYMAREFEGSTIIPNPYDDGLFRYDGEKKTKDVIFVGRLDRVKGVDVMLRAMKEASAAVRPFNATIVGEGPERLNLERLAAELGLTERVTFMGPRKGRELAELMREHEIMIVPSSYREPFGIVALEGLASGCAMIVSRHGGLVDAVGPHALTFENGDPKSLAECMVRLIGDPECRRALLERSGEHLARHRKDRIAQEYLGVLNDAVASKQRFKKRATP